jgi:hypothetical protein
MHEHLAISETRRWPGPPPGHPAPADDREWSYPGAITEITAAIGDTRRLISVSGGLLAADIAGAAALTAALLARPDAVTAGALWLLAPFLVGWLAAAALLLHAERPVAGALGALRQATGAQVDPSAPWRPVGVRQLPASQLDWSHVVPLIGATTIRHARARLALGAAITATAGLLLWVLLALAIAAVI